MTDVISVVKSFMQRKVNQSERQTKLGHRKSSKILSSGTRLFSTEYLVNSLLFFRRIIFKPRTTQKILFEVQVWSDHVTPHDTFLVKDCPSRYFRGRSKPQWPEKKTGLGMWRSELSSCAGRTLYRSRKAWGVSIGSCRVYPCDTNTSHRTNEWNDNGWNNL